MYEEVKIGDKEYVRCESLHGMGVYIDADLERTVRDKVYDYLSMLSREAFLHHIGHDYKHHFQLGTGLEPEQERRWYDAHGEDRAIYEMNYKPNSRAAVCVTRISRG